MIYPDWNGETVAVIGAGPSAADLAPHLRGRCRIIAINLSYRLVPDADVLYAADSAFWQHYHDARSFAGLKLSPDERSRLYCASVLPVIIPRDCGVRHERMIREPIGHIGTGAGNSGFQAVNLAVQFGAARVLLAGLDYAGRHWHEDHPFTLRNPSEQQFKHWRKALDDAAPTLEQWGVDVVNLSSTSTLKGFRHGDCSLLDS